MVRVGEHELTDEQAEMLVAIYEYLQLQEDTPTPLPPGIRDLMPMLGVKSTSTINYRLRKMAQDGYVLNEKSWHGVSRASTRLTYAGHHIAFTLYREGELIQE